MTDAQRRSAIRTLIKQYTAEKTVSKMVARQCLISEGIYTTKGKLRAEFGGARKGAKTAA